MQALLRRGFSSSSTAHQARPKLKKSRRAEAIQRPAFPPDNPFLPSSALVGTQWRPPIQPEEAPRFPLLVPLAAVDANLTKKISKPDSFAQDQLAVRQLTLHGQAQLHKIVEDWTRNELNVMGTVREETIQIFMKLLLHPSTLAPLAEKLKLRTAGRRVPAKASHHAPQRIVPASTVADEELSELLYYLIGSMDRTLPRRTARDDAPSPRLKRYVVELFMNGLSHTSARELLIRAGQLSGQALIGNKAGHARAEIRVAQLHIWGARRDRKIRKLVPDQIAHRTPLRLRKAAILKQRWIHEERAMVQWRNRLLRVSATQENEATAEKLRRLEHAQKVKQWNQERELRQPSSATTSSPTLLSKLFNFWPFASPEHHSPAKST
ncbi:hypothetical protein PCANC_05691 [Puccinia coronata f. sp. avenae]|uniref:Uncharacterized protein n=1 Tax=Puccinia coronata f. sp. avenae TaxID=200324 RepID=A0A2N5SME9_9BASI|nr:hypothetical protein PCASD_17060 [Puccinia coronata f. sp. avenae]PLW37617.1 hypothetical protein PCASD_09045 [Puccinia coronata f. sp. avenae]PLW54819.1 hypothetical protein PCANC_05691 [Puccinia coronata f. sp. avenae]